MTRTTNARVAGVTFLVYIAAGIASLALAGRTNVTNPLATLMHLSALVLGVTLYAITRDEDPDLALVALGCRILEAAVDPAALFFAVGSTIFSWLLLRGRIIPAALAWFGVVASILLVALLAADRAGLVGGTTNWGSTATWIVWLPMLVFELTLAGWFLVKGAATTGVFIGSGQGTAVVRSDDR